MGFEQMDFDGLKRKELQALCKKHSIPANLTNAEMAKRLRALVSVEEKAGALRKTVLKSSNEKESENESDVENRQPKKVRFGLENHTFEFEKSKVNYMGIKEGGRQKSTLSIHGILQKKGEKKDVEDDILQKKLGSIIDNVASSDSGNGDHRVMTRRSLRNKKVDDDRMGEKEDLVDGSNKTVVGTDEEVVEMRERDSESLNAQPDKVFRRSKRNAAHVENPKLLPKMVSETEVVERGRSRNMIAAMGPTGSEAENDVNILAKTGLLAGENLRRSKRHAFTEEPPATLDKLVGQRIGRKEAREQIRLPVKEANEGPSVGDNLRRSKRHASKDEPPFTLDNIVGGRTGRNEARKQKRQPVKVQEEGFAEIDETVIEESVPRSLLDAHRNKKAATGPVGGNAPKREKEIPKQPQTEKAILNECIKENERSKGPNVEANDSIPEVVTIKEQCSLYVQQTIPEKECPPVGENMRRSRRNAAKHELENAVAVTNGKQEARKRRRGPVNVQEERKRSIKPRNEMKRSKNSQKEDETEEPSLEAKDSYPEGVAIGQSSFFVELTKSEQEGPPIGENTRSESHASGHEPSIILDSVDGDTDKVLEGSNIQRRASFNVQQEETAETDRTLIQEPLQEFVGNAYETQKAAPDLLEIIAPQVKKEAKELQKMQDNSEIPKVDANSVPEELMTKEHSIKDQSTLSVQLILTENSDSMEDQNPDETEVFVEDNIYKGDKPGKNSSLESYCRIENSPMEVNTMKQRKHLEPAKLHPSESVELLNDHTHSKPGTSPLDTAAAAEYASMSVESNKREMVEKHVSFACSEDQAAHFSDGARLSAGGAFAERGACDKSEFGEISEIFTDTDHCTLTKQSSDIDEPEDTHTGEVLSPCEQILEIKTTFTDVYEKDRSSGLLDPSAECFMPTLTEDTYERDPSNSNEIIDGADYSAHKPESDDKALVLPPEGILGPSEISISDDVHTSMMNSNKCKEDKEFSSLFATPVAISSAKEETRLCSHEGEISSDITPVERTTSMKKDELSCLSHVVFSRNEQGEAGGHEISLLDSTHDAQEERCHPASGQLALQDLVYTQSSSCKHQCRSEPTDPLVSSEKAFGDSEFVDDLSPSFETTCGPLCCDIIKDDPEMTVLLESGPEEKQETNVSIHANRKFKVSNEHEQDRIPSAENNAELSIQNLDAQYTTGQDILGSTEHNVADTTNFADILPAIIVTSEDFSRSDTLIEDAALEVSVESGARNIEGTYVYKEKEDIHSAQKIAKLCSISKDLLRLGKSDADDIMTLANDQSPSTETAHDTLQRGSLLNNGEQMALLERLDTFEKSDDDDEAGREYKSLVEQEDDEKKDEGDVAVENAELDTRVVDPHSPICDPSMGLTESDVIVARNLSSTSRVETADDALHSDRMSGAELMDAVETGLEKTPEINDNDDVGREYNASVEALHSDSLNGAEIMDAVETGLENSPEINNSDDVGRKYDASIEALHSDSVNGAEMMDAVETGPENSPEINDNDDVGREYNGSIEALHSYSVNGAEMMAAVETGPEKSPEMNDNDDPGREYNASIEQEDNEEKDWIHSAVRNAKLDIQDLVETQSCINKLDQELVESSHTIDFYNDLGTANTRSEASTDPLYHEILLDDAEMMAWLESGEEMIQHTDGDPAAGTEYMVSIEQERGEYTYEIYSKKKNDDLNIEDLDQKSSNPKDFLESKVCDVADTVNVSSDLKSAENSSLRIEDAGDTLHVDWLPEAATNQGALVEPLAVEMEETNTAAGADSASQELMDWVEIEHDEEKNATDLAEIPIKSLLAATDQEMSSVAAEEGTTEEEKQISADIFDDEVNELKAEGHIHLQYNELLSPRIGNACGDSLHLDMATNEGEPSVVASGGIDKAALERPTDGKLMSKTIKEFDEALEDEVVSRSHNHNVVDTKLKSMPDVRRNVRTILIHGTPNKVQMRGGDMKENMASSKLDNVGNLTTVRPAKKRTALTDLLKN